MKLLIEFITLHLDLINLKFNKKKAKDCLNKDCKKYAIFNYKKYSIINIRKFIYCKLHKLSNMIDVQNKMCIICNCHQPYFNYKNEKKALYCYSCKEIDMIDIKNKMCIECNNSRAGFNYKNEKKALYCGKCASSNMIDIKNKKCIKCNNSQPNFNYKTENKPLYCGSCKEIDMINIKSKMCITCNNTIPYFNYKNETKALYCGKCKEIAMIDIKNKMCKTDLCNIQVNNKQYKGYCLRCFIYNFPNDKIIRDYGTREAKVSEFIKLEFKDLNITYNKQIDGGCSNHRPDIFIDCLTHSVIIEVDEHQHKNNRSYNPECELRRLNNLFTDLADRPIVFIRFNPDSYINKKNKLIKSCFEYTEDKGLPKANKTLKTRLKKLKEVIDKNLTKVPNEHITTIKLYYDGF